jgi:hypothetical protein
MRAISQAIFDIYALALPRGMAFGKAPPIKAWQSDDGISCGVLTRSDDTALFGVTVIRRRTDHVWTVTAQQNGFDAKADATAFLATSLREGDPPEPVPPGVSPRPPLLQFDDAKASNIFKLLKQPTHHLAAWLLNQLYLALPKPDANWASDCRTQNFHTRLWEVILFACFREQGLKVTQEHKSPDFCISNRLGGEAWIEAVTANPQSRYDHYNAGFSTPPPDRTERMAGPAAVRFAKTIFSKLQKRYHELPHVAGKPFAIALADFQAPASMTWSREALITYLYGMVAKVVEQDGVKVAAADDIATLLGDEQIPAGPFRSDIHSGLSAVIFSNACTIGKLNRVAVSSGAPTGPLRYVRFGEFFDRTSGALASIPFCMDVASEEYRELWGIGCEPWSAELEVFHNPYARHPIPHELLPEATHWRMIGGEVLCASFYEVAILSSRTLIMDKSKPMPTLDMLIGKIEDEV